MTISEGRSLPETGFVRLRTILLHIPVCKTVWWEGVKAGRYPKPVKIAPNVTAWAAEDIRNLIATLKQSRAA